MKTKENTDEKEKIFDGCNLFMLAVSILIGCGKETKKSVDGAISEETKEEYQQIEQRVPEVQKNKEGNVVSENEDVRITYLGQYSEDRAWVICDSDWLLIDPQGNAIVRIKGQADVPGQFDNGYSHFGQFGGNVYYTINKNGELVSQFTSDYDGEKVIAFGGGYILTRENVSNFDSVGYQYRAYNADGSLNGSFFLDNDCTASYLGNGVFRIAEGYYCAKGAAWVANIPYRYYTDDVQTFEFDGDKIIIGTMSADDEEGKCGLLILSAEGKLEMVFPDKMSSWSSVSALADGFCVIYDKGNSRIISFNTLTGKSYTLDEAYYKKLSDNAKPETPKDGRIAIPMNGADGKIYSAIFDTEFNLVAETQLGEFCGASDGRIVAYAENGSAQVYNKNGEFVFSISDMGYEAYFGSTRNQYYSCGALLVQARNSNRCQFIDAEGKSLFDAINFGAVKYINIELK